MRDHDIEPMLLSPLRRGRNRTFLVERAVTPVVQQLLEAANAAYKRGEADISKKMIEGSRKDSLADALRHEIIWGVPATLTSGIQIAAADAIDGLRYFAEQLQSVVTTLEKIDVMSDLDEILDVANKAFYDGEYSLHDEAGVPPYKDASSDWLIDVLLRVNRQARGSWSFDTSPPRFIRNSRLDLSEIKEGLEHVNLVTEAIGQMTCDLDSHRERARA